MSISPASSEPRPAPHLDDFASELCILLNQHSLDDWAQTPDFLLTQHLISALLSYRATAAGTREWHGWPTLPERLNQR